jgi:predicted nucleotidyltransferase
LDKDLKGILDEFLTVAGEHLVSVVLVGSHATGQAQKNSDIDLIVIAEDECATKVFREIVEGFDRSGLRPLLDCKVYTEEEFGRAKSGHENRFLWTCLIDGKVVWGKDISKEVQLNPKLVSDSYWQHIRGVEEACSNLQSGVRYTSSAYHLYDALNTTYFVEKFILHSIEGNIHKEGFIRQKLGGEFVQARDRYYWVMHHAGATRPSSRLQIPTAVDKKFKRSDYERMHDAARNVLELVHVKHKEIGNWMEGTL